MHKQEDPDNIQTMQRNIAYYNEIAGQYDRILDEDENNRWLRQQVAMYFSESVIPGHILDFGSGTGRDLGWLTNNGYKVIACEPSEKMREQAQWLAETLFPVQPITFLPHEATDFTNWVQRRPFPQQVRGILANFAVLNCIPDLAPLFKSFAAVSTQHTHCWGLVLNSSLTNRWKANRKETLRSLFTKARVTMQVHFNDHRQTVYLHTIRDIKKAASPYFELAETYSFKPYGFTLFHLLRK
jgi:SAM-dependent methyltransferase